jgi:hypothetical protein
MSRPNTLAELESLLDRYADATPAQKAAAMAFADQEASAYASGKKRKCFMLMSADEAAVKAGEGRIAFR